MFYCLRLNTAGEFVFIILSIAFQLFYYTVANTVRGYSDSCFACKIMGRACYQNALMQTVLSTKILALELYIRVLICL